MFLFSGLGLNMIIGLAIGEAVLIEVKVTVDFSRFSLWKILISF